MASRVQKWGNSLAIRIPRPFASAAGLTEGSEIEIAAEAGRLVIVPSRKRYSLAELLEGVTDANRHDSIETSGPMGQETW